MDATHIEVRSRRTQRELSAFARDFAAWLDHRRASDPRNAYRSQLDCLRGQFDSALASFRGNLPHAVGDPTERHAAIRQYELVDQDVVWLRRTWQFFRDMFDQRDSLEPRQVALLAAADEVVWSCWEPLYRALPTLPRRPPPLPCVYPALSPAAVPPGLWPEELRFHADLSWMRTSIHALPVPVIRLPDLCLREPWWLVLVGHEVGHHVQFALLPKNGMIAGFRGFVQAALSNSAADGPVAYLNRWGRWSLEIFADLFSIASMGPRALWAIAEFERGDPAYMAGMRDRYPPPAIRLQLMAEAWRVICASENRAADESVIASCLQGADLDAAGHPKLAKLRAQLPALAQLVVEPLPGVGKSIAQLAGSDSKRLVMRSGEWRRRLLRAKADQEAPDGSKQLWGARTAVAALADAWQRLRARGDDAQAMATLRQHGLTLVRSCRPDGDRSGASDAASTVATRLAEAIAERPQRGWEGR